MRRTHPLLAALLLAGLGAPDAQAYGLSQIQMPLPQGINSMESCITHARGVLERAGMTILGSNANSVGAEPRDASTLATVFCVMEGGVAVISVAGRNTEATGPVATQLRDTWQARTGK